MTFEALVAFALQSTLVALLALALERFVAPQDTQIRWGLWTLTLFSGFVLPLLRAVSAGGSPAPATDSVVFSIETLGRSASPQMRIGSVWLAVAGGTLLAAWRSVGLGRLRRYVANAARLEVDPVLAGEIAELEQRIGARADYRTSTAVEGPLVCGLRRPVVVLPAAFAGLPSQQRMAILAHELAHVRRKDWLKLLAEEALRCAVWFTPAIHVILRKRRVVRELETDAEAVKVTGDRHSYLNALVAIARRPTRADAPVAPLFLEPRSLKERVAVLLEERPMSRTRRLVIFAAIVLLLPIAGRWARDAFPARLQAAQATTHRVGDRVTAPRLIEKVEPALTDEARKARVDDFVELSIEVHPDGRVHNIQVMKSLGMGLDENAIAAVEQWSFEPGTKDGEPVAVEATVEVRFRVE